MGDCVLREDARNSFNWLLLFLIRLDILSVFVFIIAFTDDLALSIMFIVDLPIVVVVAFILIDVFLIWRKRMVKGQKILTNYNNYDISANSTMTTLLLHHIT